MTVILRGMSLHQTRGDSVSALAAAYAIEVQSDDQTRLSSVLKLSSKYRVPYLSLRVEPDGQA